MLLSAVGDALGYRNEQWEYCESGEQIHSELEGLGGLGNIHVCLPHWPVSDDTVLHLASAQALNTGKDGDALLH
uniref:[Protein ADP-ribosylarginine] hydrolase-like n=3 Tax=Callorhinchus milii TaxID=7868 RepID=A0A4W3GWR9_CALMI